MELQVRFFSLKCRIILQENEKAWDFAGEAYSPKGEAIKTPQVSLAKESNNKHKVAIISEVVASILAIAGGIFWYFKKFRVRG